MTVAMAIKATGRSVEDRGDHLLVSFSRPTCIYCTGGMSNGESGL